MMKNNKNVGKKEAQRKPVKHKNNRATKTRSKEKTQKRDAFFLAFWIDTNCLFSTLDFFSVFSFDKKTITKKKGKAKRLALAGTRTRIDRVAGDHSTLRPPVLQIFLNSKFNMN